MENTQTETVEALIAEEPKSGLGQVFDVSTDEILQSVKTETMQNEIKEKEREFMSMDKPEIKQEETVQTETIEEKKELQNTAPVLDDETAKKYGLVKGENGDYEYQLDEENFVGLINSELKDTKLQISNIEDLKDIVADNVKMRQALDEFESLSQEERNVIAGIRKHGFDKYNLIRSVEVESNNPLDVLWKKFVFDNPNKSESTLKYRFDNEVASKYEQIESDDLRSQMLKEDSLDAANYLKSLKADFKMETRETVVQNEQAKMDSFAKEYYSTVDKTIESIPKAIKFENEHFKVNVEVTDAEKKQVQKILDNAVQTYYNQNKKGSYNPKELESLKSEVLKTVLFDKAMLENYNQGRSDERASELKKKLNPNADLLQVKTKAVTPVLQNKEAALSELSKYW